MIRKATPKDIATVVPLWINLFDFETKLLLKIDRRFSPIRRKEIDFNTRAQRFCAAYLKDKNKLMLIAEESGKIAGFIQVGVSEDKTWVVPFRVATFDWIYVRSDFRGKGISSQLYSEARKWFKKKKCLFESVGIVPTNSVRAIYEKWGYSQAATILWKRL